MDEAGPEIQVTHEDVDNAGSLLEAAEPVQRVAWLLAYQRALKQLLNEPIPLLIWCPACHTRHIDEGEQARRVHRTHACQKCGHLFAVSVVPTVGVQFLPGCKNDG